MKGKNFNIIDKKYNDINKLEVVTLEDYNAFMETIEKYSEVLGLNESKKAEYIQKSEELKAKIESEKVEETVVEDNSISEEGLENEELKDENEELKDENESLETENSSKIKKYDIKKIAAGVILAGTILATVVALKSCSSSKDKDKENIVTTEDETKDDVINNSFKADNIESIKIQVSKLMNDMVDLGFNIEESNYSNMAEKFINYFIVANIEKFSYKTLAELDQDGYLNSDKMYQDYIEIEEEVAKRMIMAADNSIEASVIFQEADDAALVNNIASLNKKLNNATTMQEKTAVVAEMIVFKDDVISKISTNDINYSATAIHSLLTGLLYTDENAKSQTGLAVITNEENLLGIFNSGQCAEVVYTEEVDNELKETTNIAISNIANNGYRNSENTKFSNSLETVLDKALIYTATVTEKFNSSNSLENITKDILKNVNVKNNTQVMTYEEFINSNKDKYIDYLDSLKQAETVADDDTFVDDNKILESEEMTKHDASNIEEYESKVKVEEESKNNESATFKDNKDNTIETGSNVEEAAEQYSKGYTVGSANGAKAGYSLAAFNSNCTGSEYYRAGYIAGYTASYNEYKAVRIANNNKQAESSTSFQSVNGDSSEEIISSSYQKAIIEQTTTPNFIPIEDGEEVVEVVKTK